MTTQQLLLMALLGGEDPPMDKVATLAPTANALPAPTLQPVAAPVRQQPYAVDMPSTLERIGGGIQRKLADPNIQQFLMNLGGAIGGENSIGGSIAKAGTTMLQGNLEAELTAALLGGEDTTSILANPRYAALNQEGRQRAVETDLTQEANRREGSRLENETRDSLSREQTATAQSELARANTRLADATIEDRDEDRAVQVLQIETTADLTTAQQNLDKHLGELRDATIRSEGAADRGNRLELAQIEARTALQAAEIARATGKDNNAMQLAAGTLGIYSNLIQGTQETLGDLQTRRAGLVATEADEDSINKIDRQIETQQTYQRNITDLMSNVSREILTNAGIEYPEPQSSGTPSTLEEAKRLARQAGRRRFRWRGQEYNTD